MATVAALAIGAGASAYLSGKSADKQQENLDKQLKEARRIREENKKISNTAFDDITKLIEGVGSLSDFLNDGEDIGRAQSDYRMRYVLGDTESALRESLGINTKLANYDFSGINSSISDILKSNFYDIASVTRDMPTGSFANLSVANIANLAQQGLQNAINTGDYIGRISGIDQYTPYRIAQDLFSIERDKAGQKIQATNNRANQQIGINTNWFQNYSDISNASNVVEAGKTASYISAIGTVTGAVADYGSSSGTKALQKKQGNYYDSLIQRYAQPVG